MIQGDKGQRLTQMHLKLSQGGFTPSRFQPLDENIKRRDNYLSQLNMMIDAKLTGVPEAQRAIIKKNLGLTDIRPMILGGGVAAPPANTSPVGLSPAAQELMKKYGIQ